MSASVASTLPTAQAAPVPNGAAAVAELVADLAWLEGYAAKRNAAGEELILLRLAEALLTNSLGPWLAGERGGALQVAIVGGAGTGKSTLCNFLVGRALAESNPQAGFTRHPTAYVLPGGPQPRTSQPGRLGRLRLETKPHPANLDEDIFQIRTPDLPADLPSALRHAVVWDCPDMTTWQAHHYTTRLLEVIAVADLVIYAASDERYNDAIPTQFLRLILRSGKPVVAVLLKMQPHQTGKLVEHFQKEVIARIPECTRVAACLALPHLPAAALENPATHAAEHRAPLLAQVAWWAERIDATRKQAARTTVEFLEQSQEELLRPARRDLEALTVWNKLADQGRDEFIARYGKEYLTGEQFPRFNAALLRLLELLELPGVGQVVSKALYVVRTPYRLAKGFFQKVSGRVPSAGLPEEPVLRSAFTAWLDSFRRETAMRADQPVWREIKAQLDTKLVPEATTLLTTRLTEFQTRMAEEVEQTARAIYEDLERKPAALNTLRSAKFAIEFATIAGTVAFLGANLVMDVVLVPIVASLTQELVEQLGKQYVERQREKTRERQRQLFAETLANPLADWLRAWPAHDLVEIEKLEDLVARVPAQLRRLGQEVRGVAS